MRILFLTFYFRPDLSACSFRSTALADAVVKVGGKDTWVDVFTTLPNRYRSFSISASESEEVGRTRIRRFQVSTHRNGKADQALAFSSYAFQVLKATKDRSYDLVFATSSRFMTAALGAVVSRHLKIPLYLDIRDLFVDTIEDILGRHPAKMCVPLFRILERFTIQSARKISIVSEGFKDYLTKFVVESKIGIFTNGIDDEFVNVSFESEQINSRPIVLYIGNIGEGQGLHRIIPEAANRLKDLMIFRIVGDGAARNRLEGRIRELGVGNVIIEAPVPRSELVEIYRTADYLLLHLNDYPAFLKVLPSKIFEYAATGKPILAGVKGYARRFVVENIKNVAVFAPCDVEGLVKAIDSIEPGLIARKEFVDRFSRANIVRAMAQDILSVARMTGNEVVA